MYNYDLPQTCLKLKLMLCFVSFSVFMIILDFNMFTFVLIEEEEHKMKREINKPLKCCRERECPLPWYLVEWFHDHPPSYARIF